MIHYHAWFVQYDKCVGFPMKHDDVFEGTKFNSYAHISTFVILVYVGGVRDSKRPISIMKKKNINSTYNRFTYSFIY